MTITLLPLENQKHCRIRQTMPLGCLTYLLEWVEGREQGPLESQKE